MSKKKNSAEKKSGSNTRKRLTSRSRREHRLCPTPPEGTVRSEVIFIIEGLTAARPVTNTATLDALGLDQQRLTICLNTHFFPRPLDGIPDGTFGGGTRVSQVIGTVKQHLAAQGIRRS